MLKPIISACLIASLGACGGTTLPSLDTSSGPLESAAPASNLVGETTLAGGHASFAGLLNSVRIENGAGGVTYNAQLDQAAQSYAEYMIDADFFAHDGLDGSTVVERVEATGYQWSALGENLGRGQRSEAEIMKGWTDSPGHHANNINPIFEEFGLGYDTDGSETRWVLVLGTPR